MNNKEHEIRSLYAALNALHHKEEDIEITSNGADWYWRCPCHKLVIHKKTVKSQDSKFWMIFMPYKMRSHIESKRHKAFLDTFEKDGKEPAVVPAIVISSSSEEQEEDNDQKLLDLLLKERMKKRVREGEYAKQIEEGKYDSMIDETIAKDMMKAKIAKVWKEINK